MLVVLEGCDGSGKSTLARSLSMILDADIIHCTSRTPNDFGFFSSIIEASRNKNIIADRFCYGQFVYQEKENRPLGSVHNLNRLESKMLKAGTKVIYVEAPAEEIKNRLNSREECIINGLSVEDVLHRFDNLFTTQSILGDSIIRWHTGGRWQ